jgi:hypothetical protein
MAIKKAVVGVSAAPKKSADEIPEHQIDNNWVSRYIAAKKALKEAEDDIKALEPDIKLEAARYVLGQNAKAGSADLKSVKLIDKTGAAVRVTLADQYPELNRTEAEQLFEGWSLDVNDYVIETIKAAFDSKVFVQGDEFSQVVYDQFSTAIASVATKLHVPNPLSCKTIVRLKPSFNEKRFQIFTPASQLSIYAALPNKTSINIVG